MTDVRTLLRTASPPPVATFGLDRVLDAARQRKRARRRRFWAWTAGVLVVGVGGPVTGALVNASQTSSRVEAARPVPRDFDEPATTVAARATDAEGPRPRKGQTVAAPAAANRRAASTNAGQPPATPPAEGCRVDRRSTSNIQLSETGEGGGGWEQYPSCSYAATAAGGYVAKGSWRIEILRGGTTFTIDSARAPSCGTNVIQPGDQVTAYARKGVNSPDEWFVAVGANQRC